MGIYKGLHCFNTGTTMPQKAFHSLFTRVSCAFKGNRQAPKSHPTAISLGFRQNGQNLERLERLRPEQKTVFEGVSLQRGIKNDPPSNASNGLGNSKGLRERKGCSRVGRAKGRIRKDTVTARPRTGLGTNLGHKTLTSATSHQPCLPLSIE